MNSHSSVSCTGDKHSNHNHSVIPSLIKKNRIKILLNFEPRTERLCIYCPYCYNRPANVSKFCLKEACYGKGGASGAVYRRDTYGRKHIAGTGRREENLFRTGNSKILAISKRSAYQLCSRTSDFRVLHVGRTVRIHKESFDRWFSSCF